MSEYTPITGDLRERIGQAEHIVPLSGDSKDTQVRMNLAWLKENLDAIDAVHAQLERENESLKAELDRVLGEDERDGWMELPKDADGVPIYFKDKVTVPWSDKVYEVSGFSYQENIHTGTMTIWIDTHIDGKYRALCATDSCHHYTPDTWESIIEDAIGEGMARQRNNDSGDFCERANPMNNDDLVARCKALCERTKEEDA